MTMNATTTNTTDIEMIHFKTLFLLFVETTTMNTLAATVVLPRNNGLEATTMYTYDLSCIFKNHFQLFT